MSKQTVSPNSKKALLDAFDEVLKMQGEERTGRGAGRGLGRPMVITWISVFTLLFTAAYLGLERPEWLFPPAPALESTAVKEASLRIALANAARHVEHYRQQNGRLPAALDETGTAAGNILYEPIGDGYRLRGVNGPVRLTLRSTDVLAAFVGNSFEIISSRRVP
jgi:hypothetical protein